MNSRPLGELGGSSTSCCFCTANGGLFERPTAAFFTVVTAVVMPCMTVGMVGTTRRKTRFPTGVTGRHTQAKPTAVTTAFCILVSPYIILGGCGICHRPADLSAAVTPSANRNSNRVATIEGIITQGRGAAHLNPGLRNRNSYRVAGGAYRPRHILLIYFHRMEVHIRAHHSVLQWQYKNNKKNMPQLVSSFPS